MAIDRVIHTPVASIGLDVAILESKWIDRIADLLNAENYPTWVKIAPRYVSYKNEYVEKKYLYTRSSVQLYAERYRWHKSGIKQVPRDIPMTPTVFLHWHAGDGTLSKEQFQLCTDSFPLDDVLFLQDLTSRKIGIDMRHFKLEQNDKKYYRLVTSSKPAIDAILGYMDQANPDSLSVVKGVLPWRFSRFIRKKDVVKG